MRKLLLLLGLAVTLPAADHRNLDAGVPLSVEDAYPVKFREPNFHGVLFSDTRQRGLQPELEYGIARDWQVNAGARVSGESNLELGVLHNFNTETLRLPSFAAKAEIHGAEYTLKGIVTKSFGFHRVHLNGARTFGGTDRWRGVVGWDRPWGLQSLVIADVVVGRSAGAVEFGFRRQLTPRRVLIVGAGLRVSGRREQAPAFLSLAISQAF